MCPIIVAHFGSVGLEGALATVVEWVQVSLFLYIFRYINNKNKFISIINYLDTWYYIRLLILWTWSLFLECLKI